MIRATQKGADPDIGKAWKDCFQKVWAKHLQGVDQETIKVFKSKRNPTERYLSAEGRPVGRLCSTFFKKPDGTTVYTVTFSPAPELQTLTT